jgi:hypothetical protein
MASMILFVVPALAACDKPSGTSPPASTASTTTGTSSVAPPTPPAPAGSAAGPSWGGTYVASFGVTGQPVAYDVKVSSDSKKVDISADGFQTMIRMTGEGRPSGSDLAVHFVACGAEDQWHCKGIAPGDRLFVIKHAGSDYTFALDKMEAPDLKTKVLAAKKI